MAQKIDMDGAFNTPAAAVTQFGMLPRIRGRMLWLSPMWPVYEAVYGPSPAQVAYKIIENATNSAKLLLLVA